ncbi:MAG: nitrous oxide-stimulated promoter family protein [Bacteroidetes bacterium]|nr:nitrous oxide-stimulated promoter family protein [Bacteroidota bacterium]
MSIAREKRTIEKIIKLYCRSVHGGNELCYDCAELREYAMKRIEGCVFKEDKPACKECPVHCYSPIRREEIRKVMRFSGPRMIFRHPVIAIMHAIK